nr:hypothetical protein [Aliamphritea spongicola]
MVIKAGFEPDEGLVAQLKTLVRERLSTHAFPGKLSLSRICRKPQVAKFSGLFYVTGPKKRRMP